MFVPLLFTPFASALPRSHSDSKAVSASTALKDCHCIRRKYESDDALTDLQPHTAHVSSRRWRNVLCPSFVRNDGRSPSADYNISSVRTQAECHSLFGAAYFFLFPPTRLTTEFPLRVRQWNRLPTSRHTDNGKTARDVTAVGKHAYQHASFLRL